MGDESQKKPSILSLITKIINAPLVILLLGALIAGKIVIQITGFQLSIGITLLVIFCIFIAMVGSFVLGIQYPFVALFSVWFKQKMPLHFRIISGILSVLLFPWIWQERQQEKKYKASSSPLAQTMVQNMRKKGHDQSPDIH